jgi:Stress responsive A/B Barrel Domain
LTEPSASAVLAHDVYFALEDRSEIARDRLVAACRHYLAGHAGAVFFAVGGVAGEFDRPVNERDWDVALHVYFQDRASHDLYQEAPRHRQFIEEQKHNWKAVRVFDGWVEIGK